MRRSEERLRDLVAQTLERTLVPGVDLGDGVDEVEYGIDVAGPVVDAIFEDPKALRDEMRHRGLLS